MPQMSPMNWILLYMLFIITFLMFNIFNYYIFLPTIKHSNKTKLLKNNLNWKW